MVEVGWSMHLKSSENKSGMCFSSCILISNWQLSTHLSLSTFSVCQPGADRENHGLLQNAEVKLAEHHRDTDTALSSHTKHHRANSQTTSWKRSCTSRALHLRQMQLGARGMRKTLQMSQPELRGKVSAGSAVLLNTLCNFLTHVEKCRCFVLFNWRNK